MLTHAADGFLDIEDGRVEALWRSLATVTLHGGGDEPFEIQAFLVVHRQDAARVCHAAFYCRALRRTLVFSVAAADGAEVAAYGMEELARLGFRLKEVDLNLNSALRHVVLRDIPVLRRPGAGDKPGQPVVEPLPAAATAIDLGDSDSAIAKRTAALKHQRERDLDRKLQILRVAIEQRLQPETTAAGDEPLPAALVAGPAAVPRVQAEASAMAAPDQRVHAEECLAAAQRRIQELEGQLVEAESRAARLHEEKRQLSALEDQVAELTRALERGAGQLEVEQLERQELIAAHAAAITTMTEQLQATGRQRTELETALTAARGSVSAAEATHAELKKELRAARRRLKVLEKQSHEGAALGPVGDSSAAEFRAQLAEVAEERDRERARADGLVLANRQQELELAAARQHGDVLADRLQATEEALAAELRRLAEGATPLATGSGEPAPGGKPLPHQLRPAPPKGALFRPDWDMHGLPCRSADQVVQSWESVYNVQLSLEGYPSQYCAAFLVLVEQAGRRQLYLLFNLKQSRHLLVCIPGQPPADEAALLKLIDEAKRYLKKSGFEIEKIAAADVPDTLGGYFNRA
jgi:hypothetical protein